MQTSIIKNKYIFILFWIFVWHIFSVIISQDIILPSPMEVFFRILELMGEYESYLTILNSFLKIFLGFILGGIVGIFLAIFSKKYNIIYSLFTPMINVIKVIPVPSFIILALVWVDSNKLSILISFLMVVPIFFFNIYKGLNIVDKKIIEMANVYKISKFDILIYIYIPVLYNILLSTLILGFSMALKSGIASEVIGMTSFTIGGKLQEAKVLLESKDVLAWTVIIVFISIIFEKILNYMMKKFYNYIK